MKWLEEMRDTTPRRRRHAYASRLMAPMPNNMMLESADPFMTWS